MSKANGKWSIPTDYNGRRYRSKLEAGWAQWFDKNHLRFAYEEESFVIDGQPYIPDFFLPELRAFVEVKGHLDSTDTAKLHAFTIKATPEGIDVVLAESPVGEAIRFVHFQPVGILLTDGAVSICNQCERVYFRDLDNAWACRYGCRYHGNEDFRDFGEAYRDVWTPQERDMEGLTWADVV